MFELNFKFKQPSALYQTPLAIWKGVDKNDIFYNQTKNRKPIQNLSPPPWLNDLPDD